MVVRKPGVQNPHWRPWHSRNACCTGPERPVGVGQPLDGGDLAVDRGHREHQARPHRPAVDEHRAGAADAVLAADVGAGQAEVVAQRVGEQPPGGYGDVVRDAVDVQADVVERLAHCAALVWAISSPRRRRGRSAPAPAGRGSRRWRGCRRRGRGARAPRRRGRRRRRRSGRPPSVRRRPTGNRPRTVSPVDQPADPAQRVVAVAAGDLLERHPAAGGAAPGSTPTRRSRRGAARTPAGRRRGRRPRSCAGPAGRRRRPSPPSRRSTMGISAAASACTIEPTVVPRLRMVACATLARAQGDQRLDAAYVVGREHVGVPGQGADPDAVGGRRRSPSRPARPLMSTSRDGAASRIDSSGTRLCPPASTLAPGSPASAARASSSDPGRT